MLLVLHDSAGEEMVVNLTSSNIASIFRNAKGTTTIRLKEGENPLTVTESPVEIKKMLEPKTGR